MGAAARRSRPQRLSRRARPGEDAEPADAVGAPRIHVPDLELGGAKPARRRSSGAKPAASESDEAAPEPVVEAVAAEAAESTDGAEPAAAPKRKTRRGSRGGRGRKKPAAAAAAGTGAAADAETETAVATAEPAAEPVTNGGEPASDDYVPMSEWLDDLDA